MITPCFNAERFVVDTIDSVQSQDIGDWEYIVVDDGSTDDSVQVVQRAIAGDQRIRLVTQPNAGVAAARNLGADLADPSGAYMVFLDADDLVAPTFLRTLAEHLDRHDEVGLAYCGLIEVNEHGVPTGGDRPLEPRYERRGWSVARIPQTRADTPLDALVSRFQAIPSTCMFRRSVFDNTAGWRKTGVVEDKDMGLQMACLAPVHFVAEQLVYYRQHGGQRHLDEFYKSMHVLHLAWWDSGATSRVSQRDIRRAIVFDRQLAASQSFRSALLLVREHRYSASARELVRCLRHAVTCGCLWGRMQLCPVGRLDVISAAGRPDAGSLQT